MDFGNIPRGVPFIGTASSFLRETESSPPDPVSDSISINDGESTKPKSSRSANCMNDDGFFLELLSMAHAENRLPQFEAIAVPEPGTGVEDWVQQHIMRWKNVLSSDDIIPIVTNMVDNILEDLKLVKEIEDAELVKESEDAELVEEKEVAEQAEEKEVAEQAEENKVAEQAEENKVAEQAEGNKVAEESKEDKVHAVADEKVPSPDSSVAIKKPRI